MASTSPQSSPNPAPHDARQHELVFADCELGRRAAPVEPREAASIVEPRFRLRPIEFTAGQRTALDRVQQAIDGENEDRVTTGGYAGTGKTTIVENFLRYAQFRGCPYMVLAPTNKAIQVLRGKMPELLTTANSRTLHSALYGPPDEKGEFKIGRPNRLQDRQPVKLMLIDEGSMIPAAVLADIAKVSAREGIRVVLMGDDFQLEPVEESAARGPRPLQFPDVMLTEVRRQASGSPILELATVMRGLGKAVLPAESRDTLQLFDGPPEERFKMLFEKFGGDVAYIVAMNEQRVRANHDIRRTLYPNLHQRLALVPGETLMAISNSPRYTNGTIFRVGGRPEFLGAGYAEIKTGGSSRPRREHYLRFNVQDPDAPEGTFELMLFPQTTLPSIHAGSIVRMPARDEGKEFRLQADTDRVIATYGYAISCHKSQGSQWKAVMYNPDGAFLDNPRWHYTALTRAAEEAHIDMRARSRFAQASQLVMMRPEEIREHYERMLG